MATAPARSMNSDLFEGMTDGKYKKVVRGRGGFVEPTTYQERRDLFDRWYGIHEAANKTLGDGRVVVTEEYVATPEISVH